MPEEPASTESTTYEPAFHVVLHQPEIPPNTGAIGRTCVALRAKLWLIRPLGFRVDEKALRRAGLDYWQHLNWEVVGSWNELIDSNTNSGAQSPRFWMYTKTAQKSYLSARYERDDWLVFGSETSGLPASLLSKSDRNLRIPVFDNVRSLNLASAVAVAGYELARQIDLFSATEFPPFTKGG